MDCRSVMLLTVFALALGACKHKADKTQQSTADSGNSPYSFYGDDQAPSADAVTIADAADAKMEITAARITPPGMQRWDPPPIKAAPLRGESRARQLEHMPMINELSRRHGIDPAFIHAIVTIESDYKKCARSNAGAVGLMQFMPGTANGLRKKIGFSAELRCIPHLNVNAGITYFKQMDGWARGNLQAMAAGYNSGPARAKALYLRDTSSPYWRTPQPSTSNGVPGPHYWGGETYNYARKMAGYYELYKANPQLIGLGSDESPTAGSGCDEREQC